MSDTDPPYKVGNIPSPSNGSIEIPTSDTYPNSPNDNDISSIGSASEINQRSHASQRTAIPVISAIPATGGHAPDALTGGEPL